MSAKIFLFFKVFNSNSCLWTSLLYGRLSIVDSSLSPKDTKIHKIPSSVIHTHLASLMQTLSISWKFDCMCLCNVPKKGINQQINVSSQEAHVDL